MSKSKGYRLLLWWLVPIIGLGLVLLTGYQAVTNRRFEAANGVTGELLARQSVGQTFIARYGGLSGVELQLGTYHQGQSPANASLVLHLREVNPSVPLIDTGSQPDGRTVFASTSTSNSQSAAVGDLATARLAAGTPLAQNPWYLFSFPPIPDSQDRTFYAEIESPDGAPGHALTIYRWQPDSATPNGDPYALGSLYLNGRPQPGDLAFALHYEPSPPSAAGQVARAMSTNLPGWAMLALFGSVAVGAGVLLYLLAALRTQERRRRWIRRWSLPFTLGAALLSGLLYIFLVPAWQGPDEPAHFAYAAMLDHYNLDYDKVQDIYLHHQPDKQLVDAINASMARYDFTRLVAGHPAPGSPPDAGATILTALGKPPAYYWLGAIALRAARMSWIAADPYTNVDTSIVVLRGVSVVLGLVVVALAWLAARIITGLSYSSADDGAWLMLLLPMTVALLPMHTFDTAIFDNDVLAEVAVSAVFVVLAALLRWPTGWRAVALAALAVLLTVCGIFTKPTAEAAVPLVAGVFLVWIGLFVTRALSRRKASNRQKANVVSGRLLKEAEDGGWVDSRRRAIALPGAVAGVLVVLTVGSLVASYQAQNDTAGWLVSWVPLVPMHRTATPTAHDGSFVLDLGPKGYQAVTAVQMLLPPVYHPAMKINVAGWVRVAPGASKPLTIRPTAVLRIEQGGSLMARTDVFLDPAGVWQPINATADIGEDTQQIVLRITSASQRAQFDDFALHVDDGPVAWHDPVFQPTLLNPSAESGFLGLRPELASRLPFGVVAAADVLPNPQPFDEVALWEQYANGQYTSFWGNFGWLSIPLPDSLYMVLAIITLLALTGLVVRVSRRWITSANGGWTTVDWLGLVVLFSLVGTIVVTYASQMMQLATRGITAGLSGRYLFVLIIPIAWLLLAGLGSIPPLLRFSPRRSGPESTGMEAALPWAIWLYVVCLMLFAAYCFLALIVPYYYA